MAHEFDDVTSNGTKNGVANGNSDCKEPSKLRQAVPQCTAVAAKNLLLLTFGSTLGFATILIPALQGDNPDIPVTMEELTWISSINLFVVPLGCLVSGPASQRWGRRRLMMWTNLPFIISWLIFYFANSSGWLFLALVITGLNGGLTESPVMTYVSEVTQPHLRGMLAATATLAVIIGVFTQMLTGSFVTWRTACLINLIYPVICFLALLIVPESPFWLAGNGRLKEAEESLCWLRGWVEPKHVAAEFRTICENVSKHTEASKTKQEKRPMAAYLQRTFYIPFALVSFAFFIAAFGGSATLQTFAVVIFADLNAPIDKYTATVFLGIAELAGTLLCVFAIHFAGKRKLSFWSIGGTGLCFLLATVYGYLIEHKSIDGESYTWIPTTLMIGAAFLSHMGIRLLPWVLAGEVFAANVRSCATGASGSIGYIFTSIANKVFLYMTTGMTLPGTFLFYGIINVIGGATLYFILPETEGRTLMAIENHFAGIKSLNDKPDKVKMMAEKEKWAATNPIPVRDDIESRL